MMNITKEERKILEQYKTSKMLGEPFYKPPGIEHERLSDIIFSYEAGENIVTRGVGEITKIGDDVKKGYVLKKFYEQGKELEMKNLSDIEKDAVERFKELDGKGVAFEIPKEISFQRFLHLLKENGLMKIVEKEVNEDFSKKLKVFPEIDDIFLEGEIYAINFLIKILKELEEIDDFILSDLENSIECEMRDIKFKFADRWVNHFFEKDGKQ